MEADAAFLDAAESKDIKRCEAVITMLMKCAGAGSVHCLGDRKREFEQSCQDLATQTALEEQVHTAPLKPSHTGALSLAFVIT